MIFSKLKETLRGDKGKSYEMPTIHDLDTGCIFEYDLQSWEVVEAYKYDWGDNFFSSEFKIYNGTKYLFLSVEEEDELELIIWENIKFSEIEEDVRANPRENKPLIRKLTYQNKVYTYEEECPGYFKKLGKNESDWTEFISWDYYSKKGKYALSVEQWGEDEFDASCGKVLEKHEISNILPKPEK